jgi:hypothetical protein
VVTFGALVVLITIAVVIIVGIRKYVLLKKLNKARAISRTTKGGN